MPTCPIIAGPVTYILHFSDNNIAGVHGAILDVVCVGSPVIIITVFTKS